MARWLRRATRWPCASDFNAPLFSAQTYPREWLETYTLNAYALRDPMVAWGLSTTGTTRWSGMTIPDPAGSWNMPRSSG